MFTTGAIAGGIVVLAAYLGWIQPRWKAEPVPPPRTFSLPGPELPAQQVASAELPSASAAQPVAATGNCPSQPLAHARGSQDGKFALDAALSPAASMDPSSFLNVAREAAEQGHVRDTEVALIAACHAAQKSYGLASAPLADIKSQMGQHYVALAAQEDLADAREQLLQRASGLFAESANAYAGALGKDASKTRLAEQRLAALREPGATLPRADPLVVASRRSAAPEPDTSRLGAARSSSLADRPPLRTEDLGKVEEDLDRLYNQARSVSRDPAGMQRRQQQALAQRSACRGDPECLRGWAAQRRRQLFGEF